MSPGGDDFSAEIWNVSRSLAGKEQEGEGARGEEDIQMANRYRKEMLSLINHQRNENPNCNEISSHPS